MVHLVGPGGAGKTTTGAALADQLGVSFVDLDARFCERHGDISAFIGTHGYDDYAGLNVGLFSDLVSALGRSDVVALSSGFMTYPDDVHPEYVGWREHIASSSSTFVLLPSLDLETCVAEIVRRQLGRPFSRTADREEHVIRTRFPIYSGLHARKVETMRKTNAVVAELVAAIAAQQAAAPDGTGARWRAPLALDVS